MKLKYTRYQPEPKTFAFENAEEAWFWFIAAQKATQDGAQARAGLALYPRPCEPMDIFKVVETLHRTRRLMMDHMMVLRHYGMRMMRPDARRHKEVRAAALWNEAMDKIETILIRKKIVKERDFLATNPYQQKESSVSLQPMSPYFPYIPNASTKGVSYDSAIHYA